MFFLSCVGYAFVCVCLLVPRNPEYAEMCFMGYENSC